MTVPEATKQGPNAEPEHNLVVLNNERGTWSADRRQLWLKCPDCDLTIHATIGPARQADHLIATLIDAHHKQVRVS